MVNTGDKFGNFYKIFKEKVIHVYTNSPGKLKKREPFLSHSMRSALSDTETKEIIRKERHTPVYRILNKILTNRI